MFVRAHKVVVVPDSFVGDILPSIVPREKREGREAAEMIGNLLESSLI
jgi:hypothetical protein